MRKKWVPNWSIALLILFSAGTVWLRLWIVRTTYSVHEINRELEQIRKEREILTYKISALKSPRRLEALARQGHFNLEKPKLDQIIHLGSPEEGIHP